MPACYSIRTATLVMSFVTVSVFSCAQDSKPAPRSAQPATTASRADSSAERPQQEWSGMYTFLKEGEFVQLTVEDDGHVTGFVSRYGDGDSDKGAFLDQFFKNVKVEGNRLDFTTEVVHGVWFEFKGTVERGEGKSSGDEAYYILSGKLVESSTDANKKVTARARDVVLKMFPQEAAAGPAQTNPSPRN
jgi:hypothetical protein